MRSISSTTSISCHFWHFPMSAEAKQKLFWIPALPLSTVSDCWLKSYLSTEFFSWMILNGLFIHSFIHSISHAFNLQKLSACAISCLHHKSEQVIQKWKELRETQYLKTKIHKWFRSPSCYVSELNYQTDGVSQQEGKGLRIPQICLRTCLRYVSG